MRDTPTPRKLAKSMRVTQGLQKMGDKALQLEAGDGDNMGTGASGMAEGSKNKLPQTSPNLEEEASSSSRQFPMPDYAALRDRASQSPEVAKRCQLVLGDWCGPYIVQVNNCKIFNESAPAVSDALAVHS